MRKILIIISLGILTMAIGQMASSIFGYFSADAAEPMRLYTGNQINIQLSNHPIKAGAIEFVDKNSGSEKDNITYKEKYKGIFTIAKIWEEQQYADEGEEKVRGIYIFGRERFNTGEKIFQMLPYLESEYSFVKQTFAYLSIVSGKSLVWGKPYLVGKQKVYTDAFAKTDPINVEWNFSDPALESKADPFDDPERKNLQTIFSGKHVAVLLDYAPLTDLHFLFITHAPKKNLFETTEEERNEFEKLKEKLTEHYKGKFSDPILNVMIATHSSAGQTVNRCHWHVVFCDGIEQEKIGQKNTGWKLVGKLPPLSNDELARRVKNLSDELTPVLTD